MTDHAHTRLMKRNSRTAPFLCTYSAKLPGRNRGTNSLQRSCLHFAMSGPPPTGTSERVEPHIERAMEEHNMPARSRKLGSSRRKQMRGVSGGAMTAPIPEEQQFPPEIMEKIQDFFQECDKDQKGFITRADMQKLKREDFPCIAAELELIFDGLDTDRNGYLTTEEFTAGLKQFLNLQTATKAHRRRKTASRRVFMAPTDHSLEEADSEERKCFQAFMDQLGADNIFEDQSEIWGLWVKLRQDEPQLLGNLEEFLAKMTNRIKDTRREKVTLELTLNKVTDHNREVQQLYEETEQQIKQEKQRLQHESKARTHLHTTEMQRALDIVDSEVQRVLLAQSELETQFHSLSTKQFAAATENQRLKQNNQDLENQLQQIHIQLQETQGHLGAMRGKVSWLHSEEQSDRPLAEATQELPLPSQDSLNKDETSCSERQIRLASQQSGDTSDSSRQLAPCSVSVAPEADPGQRTRVISIEEDPFPEFMKEGDSFFQQELSSQSSLLRELNDAIAALHKGSDPHIPQMDDLPQGDASVPSAGKGRDSEQRLKRVRESEHQVLSGNDNEPKALPNTLSDLSPNQAPSQGETLKQGLTQAESCAQEGKQPGASEPATHDETQQLRPRDPLCTTASKPTMQIAFHKKSPPKGGILQPDGWQPGVSEQTVPDEIQKWGSMTRDVLLADMWLFAASEQRQLEEKAPEMKVPEKTFEQSETLREETTPTYLPYVGALQEEGIENEGGEALLGASQLGVRTQAKTQLQSTGKPEVIQAEGSRGDTAICQWEEKEESSVKASKDAVPKSGGQQYQANVTPEQPGRAEISPDPDHLYNVLFVGDSNVGKTSFLYRLHEDSFNPNLTATVGVDYRVKNLFVDNKCFALRLWDTAGQERYHSVTKQFFRKADGVVLMYDVTSAYSFADVRYWLTCIQEGAGDGIVILLLGNKTDCGAERQVSTEEGEHLAKEYELLFYECSAASGHQVSESMFGLARSLKAHEDRLKTEVVDVPKPPKKKRGCCG
nr:ras-related protein Rab-44 isoform X2 [Pelodiscus sinensis]|eukprot:XP_014430176.1 ras-related protein Rab-44 isoform X2 [Pelodiscus sinensis]